uniref:Uncharacterized protein n=1 Tax=Ditylenchus dipsaci TaxID=166011 RepID=A0A915DZW9_9BILA
MTDLLPAVNHSRMFKKYRFGNKSAEIDPKVQLNGPCQEGRCARGGGQFFFSLFHLSALASAKAEKYQSSTSAAECLCPLNKPLCFVSV